MASVALHEKLLRLAQFQGITQTEIAKKSGMQLSHVNRYFNGRSDITSAHLIKIMKVLGVDFNEIIADKVYAAAGGGDIPNELPECVEYLLNSLDDIGKQTYLSQLLWAAKKTSKKKIPENVISIVKEEISLI